MSVLENLRVDTKSRYLSCAQIGLSNRDSMAAWKQICAEKGMLDAELLTPAIVFPANPKGFSFLGKPLTLTRDKIEHGIKSLAPWTYHVEAGGVSTSSVGTYNERTIKFHQFRNSLICQAVDELFFGTNELKAKSTILDIGCNCGFFTLEMACLGAAKCIGIDLRDENIKQAEWLRGLFGIENAEFRVGNVKNLQTEQHDVVLNLGLMYHLSTPFEILKACFEITKTVCVIDSVCHTEPFSGYHVVTQKNTSSPIEGDLSFEFQPTYRGLLDTIYAAGFTHVIELIGLDSADVDLYSNLSRRCLMAFKSEPNLEDMKRAARSLG